jgi:hypothetical protein
VVPDKTTGDRTSYLPVASAHFDRYAYGPITIAQEPGFTPVTHRIQGLALATRI